MESAKAGAVAGEEKAVTSGRSSFGMISCGAPESVEAVTAKPVAVEQTGKAHSTPERDAQYGCMPVVSKAGNRVTWNRFLFVRSSLRQSRGGSLPLSLASPYASSP
jgi:hypothetical protein